MTEDSITQENNPLSTYEKIINRQSKARMNRYENLTGNSLKQVGGQQV
jgi:hypothetical protein